jgi:hypothetical protein
MRREVDCGMEQRQTLTYLLNTKGTVDFPPPELNRELALRWVTQNTNKTLNLTEPPALAGDPPPTDEEATFLLYYLYKHGNPDARLTELHILAPVARPADGQVACGYVVLRYLPQRAAATLLKRSTPVPLTASRSEAAGPEVIKALRSEFGLGPVEAEGGAVWTDLELKKVRVALKWLPEPHRVVLDGLTLVRVKEPANQMEAGGFTWDTQGENRLELSDRAFQRDDVRFQGKREFVPAGFVGGGERVGPQSLQTILHELGHAVEAYRLRAEATRLKRASDSAHTSYEATYRESQSLQRQWSEAKQRQSPDEAKLSAAWKVKDRAAETARSLFADAERLYQERADQGSARLRDFEKQVHGNTRPITSYAATSPKEFFAEAYAAWRADPEFLQANAPRAFAWFEKLSQQAP